MSVSISRLGAIKAAAIMALSTYITVALGLVVSALLARQLGPTEYGRYAYVLWMVGVLVTFGNHGIPVTATRFISETLGAGNKAGAASIYGWLQRTQWVSLLLVSVLFAVLMPYLQPAGWQDDARFFLAITLVCFLPKSVYQFHTSAAKGHWQFWVEAWGNMATSLIYTCGVVVLTWTHATLHTNLYWFAAVSLSHIGVVWWLRRRAGIVITHGPIPESARQHLTSGMAWTSMQVLVSALGARTVDVYLLSRLIGTAEVGYYTLASNLARGGIELLSSSLSTLLMPTMARARGQGGFEQVKPILADANRYFLFLGLSLAGVGLMWARPAVVMIYGSRYELLVPVLQWMVLLSSLALLDNPISSLLLIIDDQRVRTVRAVAIMVVSAASSITLIPMFGLMGAVAASGVNALIIIGGYGVYAYRMIGFQMPWKPMLGILLAACLAGLMDWGLLFVSSASWMHWLGGVAYLLVFWWLTLMFNVWTPRDLQLLLSLMAKKPAMFGPLLPWMQQRLAHVMPPH
jgi:O-antigen/teichoic acid export membrane protein